MDIISEICMSIATLENTSKINFIKRNKLNKQISSLSNSLYDLDIFLFSNNINYFLSKVDKKFISNNNIFVNGQYMKIKIDNILFEYNCHLEEFEIDDTNYGKYFVSRSMILPKKRKEIWEASINILKEFYISIIISVSINLAKER